MDEFTRRLTDSVIDDVNKRLSEKFYRDEPILFPASRLKSGTPPEIAELYRESRIIPPSPEKKAQRFYEQAVKMKDFEDDFSLPKGNVFPHYYVHHSYSSYNTAQLRAYFSWRTRIRRGDIVKADDIGFITVYLFELVHLIGSDSPYEGLERLVAFKAAYTAVDDSCGYIFDNTLSGFIIYHGLEKELYQKHCLVESRIFSCALADPYSVTDDMLFDAICHFSAYSLERSALYTKYPEQTRELICIIYRENDDYYRKQGKNGFFERLFGKSSETPADLFTYIPFCEKSSEDMEYVINPVLKFIRRNGQYYRISPLVIGKNQLLGKYIRTADSILRGYFKGLKALGADIDSEVFSKSVKRAVKISEERKQKKAAQKIVIDLTRLDSIKAAADITRDSLIIEEETEAAPSAPAATDIPADEAMPAEPCTCENKYGIDSGEYAFISELLQGGSGSSAASALHSSVSLLADSVNEKLFELLGDNAVDFSGDIPVIIEDYIDDIKGALNI